MSEMQSQESDTRIKEAIAKELTPQGDLLPPWQKYPNLERYSIGWKMGSGESYTILWDKWASQMNSEQLVEYFRKYSPIPVEWLDWVAYRFGDKDIISDMYSGNGKFAGIHWLEQQGLAKYSEFKSWYDNTWKISEDESLKGQRRANTGST